MQNFKNNGNHVTWREADKSWLKAKGRSLRTVLDSAQREEGIARYMVAGVATIVMASAVGLSGVFAGPDLTSNALTSTLSPLAGVVETVTGSPGSASAQALQECGPVAADVAVDSDGNNTQADTEISFDPDVPTLLGPEDFPIIPPILIINDDDNDDDNGNDDDGNDDDGNDDDGNDDDGNDDDGNDDDGNDDDGNEDPGGSSLIGADINLLGEDILDIGLLSGNLLGVGVNGLDPNGTGTGAGLDVNLQDDDLLDVNVDPQADNPLGVELQGEDLLDQELLNGTGVQDTVTEVVDTVTGEGGGLLDGLLGGGDPLGDILGNDLLGGLLN